MKGMMVILIILLASAMVLVSCAKSTSPTPPAEPIPIPTPSEEKTEEGEGAVTVEEPAETSPTETPLPIIEVEWKTGGPYGEIHPFSSGIEDFDFGNQEGNIVYALEYGTLWKTENSGKTWVSILKGPIEAVFLIDPTDSNVMYVSKRRWVDGHGSGFLKSIDGGKTWTTIETPKIHIEAIGPGGELYGVKAEEYQDLFLSKDGGKTWSEVLRLTWQWKTTPEGKFKSLDRKTWFKIDENVAFGEIDHLSIRIVAPDPKDENTIYLGVETPFSKWVEEKRGWVHLVQLLKTTDGGKSWRTLPTLIGGCPKQILIDRNDPKIIYVETVNYTRLLKSTDSGESWKEMTFQLPHDSRFTPSEPYVHRLIGNSPAEFLAMDPNNGNNLMLYAWSLPLPKPEKLPPNWKDFVYHKGYISKLFLSFDGGESWREINSSLFPEKRFSKVALISTENSLKLFAVEWPLSEKEESQVWISSLPALD